MNAVQKLRQLVGEIKKAGPGVPEAWGLAGRLLSRLPVDQVQVQAACEARDIAALDGVVSRLERPEASRQPAPTLSPQVPDDVLKAALRAFNKRLKLSRLADESRLGNRYVTGGRKSAIDAIIPPNEFGPEVWKALAAAGQLRDTGNGFYAPAEPPTA
jgi:hypothetical protein